MGILNLGLLQFIENSLDDAHKTFQSILTNSINKNYIDLAIQSATLLGDVLSQKKQYQEALKAFETGLKFQEQTGIGPQLYSRIARCKELVQDWTAAAEFYEKTANEAAESYKSYWYAYASMNAARQALTEHKFMDAAFKYVEAARAFEESNSDSRAAIASFLIEVAKVDHAFMLGLRNEGIEAAKEAIVTLNSCGNISTSPIFVAECQYWHSCLYAKINMEEAFILEENGKIEAAIEKLRLSIPKFEKLRIEQPDYQLFADYANIQLKRLESQLKSKEEQKKDLILLLPMLDKLIECVTSDTKIIRKEFLDLERFILEKLPLKTLEQKDLFLKELITYFNKKSMLDLKNKFKDAHPSDLSKILAQLFGRVFIGLGTMRLSMIGRRITGDHFEITKLNIDPMTCKIGESSKISFLLTIDRRAFTFRQTIKVIIASRNLNEKKIVFTPNLLQHFISYEIESSKPGFVNDVVSIFDDNRNIIYSLSKDQKIEVMFE